MVQAKRVKPGEDDGKAEVPTVHMYSPDVLSRWKRVVVKQTVYEDALQSHANNSILFRDMAKERKAVGGISRTDHKEMKAAESAVVRAEKRLEAVKTKVKQETKKETASSSSSTTAGSGSSSSTDMPEIQYERLTMNDLRALIKKQGIEPKGKYKADLIKQLRSLG